MGNTSIIYVLVILFMLSCVSDQRNKTKSIEPELGTIEEKQESVTHITYKVPSPLETYILIKANEGRYYSDLISPPANVDHYLTNYEKALNFGVYSSDMVYATINGDYENTIELFRASKILSEGLGIHQGFSQTIANRIDKNLYNIDSLSKLTSESYWESCKYLEEVGMSEFLSLILCGGFIEATYILGHTIEEPENPGEMFQRFIEQGVILNNLIEYLESVPIEDSKNLIKSLQKLQSDYDEIYDTELKNVTKEQFGIILSEVDKIRNKIISY